LLADLPVADRVESGNIGDAGIGVELDLSLFPVRETLPAKLAVGRYSEWLVVVCAQEPEILSDRLRRTTLTKAL